MADNPTDLAGGTCTWTMEDDIYETFYETSCKNAWVMMEGDSPKDNDYIYCPSCGRRIEVAKGDDNGLDDTD